MPPPSMAGRQRGETALDVESQSISKKNPKESQRKRGRRMTTSFSHTRHLLSKNVIKNSIYFLKKAITNSTLPTSSQESQRIPKESHKKSNLLKGIERISEDWQPQNPLIPAKSQENLKRIPSIPSIPSLPSIPKRAACFYFHPRWPTAEPPGVRTTNHHPSSGRYSNRVAEREFFPFPFLFLFTTKLAYS